VETAVNPRLTLIVIVVLAALAGYVYLFELSDEVDNDATTDIQIYGTTYGEYDVVELEIAGPQGTARFARTNETFTRDWQMFQPTSLTPEQLDQVWVNGAASRLARLTAGQVITNVTDLTSYGLDPAVLTVTLTISDGQKIALMMGDETPVDNNRYLLTGTDNQSVYVVFGLAVDDLYRLLVAPPLAPTPLPTLMATVSP
jgi:hypothetical protein